MSTSFYAIKGVPAPTSAGFSGITSAYDLWLEAGNSGTVQDYFLSLTGPVGPEGPQGPQGEPGGLRENDIVDGGNF